MDFSIRAANVEDCKDIARMIRELAEYEKVADNVRVTQRGHTKIGYALYFYSYSSWTGRAIYMEDLYVMPEFRGKGIGKALMSKVAQLGLAAGCNQLNFTVLDWNKSSLDFYLSQGCFDITDKMGYHCMRCEGEALEHLAQP
ncbi:thialysine N-epsilon-acetyltransferase isoform 3-T3 [Fundulus diaphanus]